LQETRSSLESCHGEGEGREEKIKRRGRSDRK
jgi:hypothetical protein